MTELLRVMQIIDQYSNVIPEGEYLEACNILKKSYEERNDPIFLFDYDNFRIPPVTPENTFHYFHDYYFDKAVRMDSDFINGSVRYLEDELDMSQPLRNITKAVKETVRQHCCAIQGDITGSLTLEDMSIGVVEFRNLCKTYLHIENDFRERYRNSIVEKIRWFERSEEHMETL